MGTLYIVGTPIGNLSDLAPRAESVLREVDFVAAEDTRVTLRLLNHLGLKKPLLSYREHNEATRSGQILDRIAAGENCALCSDAGLPAISDPGEVLVRDAYARGIPVVPVPGPNAALTALCASGQSTARFVFEGFLPMNRAQRQKHLLGLQNETRTLLFYEAPHKLSRTLRDLEAAFGAGRSLTLCRELTKLHEEFWKTTLGEAAARYEAEKPRGEFVLVLAGAAPAAPEPALSLDEAAREALVLAETEGLSASEAAKRLAASSGHAKSQIYKAMQKAQEKV